MAVGLVVTLLMLAGVGCSSRSSGSASASGWRRSSPAAAGPARRRCAGRGGARRALGLAARLHGLAAVALLSLVPSGAVGTPSTTRSGWSRRSSPSSRTAGDDRGAGLDRAPDRSVRCCTWLCSSPPTWRSPASPCAASPRLNLPPLRSVRADAGLAVVAVRLMPAVGPGFPGNPANDPGQREFPHWPGQLAHVPTPPLDPAQTDALFRAVVADLGKLVHPLEVVRVRAECHVTTGLPCSTSTSHHILDPPERCWKQVMQTGWSPA